jgi:hypothetical protein
MFRPSPCCRSLADHAQRQRVLSRKDFDSARLTDQRRQIAWQRFAVVPNSPDKP